MHELYHWEPNSYSLAALMTLYEKGADFKSRYVDFLGLEQYGLPVFTETDEAVMNLEIEGPVLVADRGPVAESFFMGLYVDEAVGGDPLSPRDAAGHYHALAWARHIGETLAPAIATLGCVEASKALTDGQRKKISDSLAGLPGHERQTAWAAFVKGDYSDDLIADSRRKIGIAVEKAEDALLKDGPWLLGAKFSTVDIETFAQLKNALHLAPDLIEPEKAPKTNDWLKEVKARASYEKAMTHAKSPAPQTAFVPGPEHSRWG